MNQALENYQSLRSERLHKEHLISLKFHKNDRIIAETLKKHLQNLYLIGYYQELNPNIVVEILFLLLFPNNNQGATFLRLSKESYPIYNMSWLKISGNCLGRFAI